MYGYSLGKFKIVLPQEVQNVLWKRLRESTAIGVNEKISLSIQATYYLTGSR
jgi:hypothetical protein